MNPKNSTSLLKLILATLLSLVVDANTRAADAAWQTVNVPGAINVKGTVWLRCWLLPDAAIFKTRERNLYEDTVGIHFRQLAGAHEIFVNGTKIGSGGEFPPAYRAAGEEFFRHKVPVGTLKKRQWNEIAIRVHQADGAGGFQGEAPFLMSYRIECVLEGGWELLAGGDYQPGKALTAKPARATFATFKLSNRVLGRAEQFHGPKLAPAESFAKMQSADDLKVDLLLHEPLVAQPFHFSFDERGRLWIAQARQYPYPAGINMVSRDAYYRSHYDKVPPAPPNHDRGADVISIHEDTDGDGRFDKHKVFQDGLNMANSVVRGRGGVWVMHTPHLIFYPDKDGDDIPDGPPVTQLTGFGFEDTHSMANSLTWGPDGWLYGAQGSTTTSRVTRPGLDPADAPGVRFEGCMVWRYHPDTRAYELFAEGSGNPFGLEFDAQGRLFSGHNGGKTRGWHYVQGAYYLKQGADPGKYGPPRNPYAFGDLPMMATLNDVPRFSHIGAMVEGSAMPSRYAGTMFSLDPLHSTVIASDRRKRGATFLTEDIGTVVSCGDAGFRPVYIANAPDGSLFVADMYEYFIAHGQHYQNQIDPTTGRIYRLRGKDAKLETDFNLAAKSSADLVKVLGHPNKWHRQTAVRLLGERKDASSFVPLRTLLASDHGQDSLEALWALHQAGGLDEAGALMALRNPYPPTRMWAVRLLGDRRELTPTLLAAVVAQAGREDNVEVRSQMAATARRLPTAPMLQVLGGVLRHGEDAPDPFVPLQCWWALEEHIRTNREAVLAMFSESALWDQPVVFEHLLPRVMKRFALEGKRADLLVCASLLRQAPSPKHAAQLMRGFEEAYRGRAMTGLPDALVTAMAASGGSPLILRVRQSEPAALAQALKIIADKSAKPEDRLLYTRAFGEVRHAPSVPALTAIASGPNDLTLRKAALASLAAYDDAGIPAQVLALLPVLPVEVKSAALALLASRPAWTLALLESLQAGKVSLSAIPPDMADRLRLQRDPALAKLAAKLFPRTDKAGEAHFAKRLAEVETALKRGQGDAYAGEAHYMARCAGCHKLFFKGGSVGPELTHYQRDNLGTMLLSIINPNAEIREGYQYYQVETRDGRSLGGFVVDRDTQVTVLRGLDGQDVTLGQADLKDISPMGRSLMPDGLLEGLDEKQLRDLFAYLRITQPISK